MEDGKSADTKSSVSFAIVDETPTSNNQKGPGSAKRSTSKRSSFFRARSMSFRRSGGERGADIETLRGTNGPDFEGYAVVNRAGPAGLMVCCNCFGGGGGDDMKEKIVLIKGPYCFVFNKETDQAPKYAIALAHMTTTTQPSPARDGQFPVTIETSMGDAEWELIFQKKNIAKQFVASFKQQAAVGEADEVRKRLGHDELLGKRTSVMYAEKVAEKKIAEQPEKKENVVLGNLDRVEPMMTGY